MQFINQNYDAGATNRLQSYMDAPDLSPITLENIRGLIAAGADPNSRSTYRRYSILQLAMMNGQRELFAYLLTVPGIIVESDSVYHRQLICDTVVQNTHFYARALMRAQIDYYLSMLEVPERHNGTGFTPLLLACRSANVPVKTIKLLLWSGASCLARGGFNQNAIHCVLDTIPTINSSHAGDRPIRDIKLIIKLLLEHGADIDAQDDHGKTPAYIAAQYANSFRSGGNIFRFLLYYHADIDIPDFVEGGGAKTARQMARRLYESDDVLMEYERSAERRRLAAEEARERLLAFGNGHGGSRKRPRRGRRLPPLNLEDIWIKRYGEGIEDHDSSDDMVYDFDNDTSSSDSNEDVDEGDNRGSNSNPQEMQDQEEDEDDELFPGLAHLGDFDGNDELSMDQLRELKRYTRDGR
jgi:ankyrin repeat protein